MELTSVSSKITGIITTALLLLCAASYAKPHPAAIVMEYPSQTILYSENPTIVNQPASLTKVMTLYLVFDALNKGVLKKSQPLMVTQHAAGRQPSKLGLKPQEVITVEQAICGLVTKSANDAAAVLAESLAPSEEEFAQLMTTQARKLGMNQTTFMNASGIANKQQVTTALDMAKLGAAIMQDFPQYYHYFSLKEFSFHHITFKNHNHLLGKYPGCDGIKTGYTAASGFNLLSSAQRDGHRLIAVVLGGNSIKSRDLRMMQILNTAFSKLPNVNLATKPETAPATNLQKVSQENIKLDMSNTTIEVEF